jgi:hypothetical protein
MTERDRREGTGGTEDNVRDELDEATGKGRKKDATPDAVEDEEATGGGGVKDNVRDEHDETQRRR